MDQKSTIDKKFYRYTMIFSVNEDSEARWVKEKIERIDFKGYDLQFTELCDITLKKNEHIREKSS